MRCLTRNMRQMWLSKPELTELVDAATGLGTGEFVNGWSEPESVRINASAPSGESESSPFGTASSYDLTLVADSNAWGIEEGNRMWLADAQPDASDTKSAYLVKRVSPSLNFVAFGLTRCEGK